MWRNIGCLCRHRSLMTRKQCLLPIDILFCRLDEKSEYRCQALLQRFASALDTLQSHTVVMLFFRRVVGCATRDEHVLVGDICVSQMYALGALSTEWIFGQAILSEIGLSFLIHAGADSSTARAVVTKQGASRKMKHISHEILIHSRMGIWETSNDVISQDWCESEWYRDESAGMWTIPQIKINVCYDDRSHGDEFTWQVAPWRRVTRRVIGYGYEGLDESNDWHTWVSEDLFLKIFSVQRGSLRESDTASRREEACLLIPCNAVAQ